MQYFNFLDLFSHLNLDYLPSLVLSYATFIYSLFDIITFYKYIIIWSTYRSIYFWLFINFCYYKHYWYKHSAYKSGLPLEEILFGIKLSELTVSFLEIMRKNMTFLDWILLLYILMYPKFYLLWCTCI